MTMLSNNEFPLRKTLMDSGLQDNLKQRQEDLASRILTRLATSDEFTDMVERNIGPYKRLMTYYTCAMMEVETKFRVLDAEYGLQHDRNPIESIKTRLKSMDSLAKKLTRKGFPFSVDSIEQNIYDVAGVRVVCTFPEDMFTLADALLAPFSVDSIEQNIYDVAGVRVVCTFPEDMFTLADALLAQDDVTLVERRDCAWCAPFPKICSRSQTPCLHKMTSRWSNGAITWPTPSRAVIAACT